MVAQTLWERSNELRVNEYQIIHSWSHSFLYVMLFWTGKCISIQFLSAVSARCSELNYSFDICSLHLWITN